MTANDARAATTAALSPTEVIAPMLESVYRRIADAASRGERSISFPLYGYRGQYTANQEKAVLNELRNQGYEVTHHTADSKDPRERSYDSVSW
jgi:hypothetical protein